MGLKHVVEHLVDRKQKTYGKYCRTGGDENLALRYAQSLKQNVAYGCADYCQKEYQTGNHHTADSEQPCQNAGSGKPYKHVARHCLQFAVYGEHGHKAGLNHDKYSYLSRRDTEHKCLCILYRRHEKHYGGECGCKHKPAHTLAVEHKKQSQIGECRAGLFLGEDEEYREEDNQQGFQVVGGACVETEIIGRE